MDLDQLILNNQQKKCPFQFLALLRGHLEVVIYSIRTNYRCAFSKCYTGFDEGVTRRTAWEIAVFSMASYRKFVGHGLLSTWYTILRVYVDLRLPAGYIQLPAAPDCSSVTICPLIVYSLIN